MGQSSARQWLYITAGEESGAKNKAGGLSLDRGLGSNKGRGSGWDYGERLVDKIERTPAAANGLTSREADSPEDAQQ